MLDRAASISAVWSRSARSHRTETLNELSVVPSYLFRESNAVMSPRELLASWEELKGASTTTSRTSRPSSASGTSCSTRTLRRPRRCR